MLPPQKKKKASKQAQHNETKSDTKIEAPTKQTKE